MICYTDSVGSRWFPVILKLAEEQRRKKMERTYSSDEMLGQKYRLQALKDLTEAKQAGVTHVVAIDETDGTSDGIVVTVDAAIRITEATEDIAWGRGVWEAAN